MQKVKRFTVTYNVVLYIPIIIILLWLFPVIYVCNMLYSIIYWVLIVLLYIIPSLYPLLIYFKKDIKKRDAQKN